MLSVLHVNPVKPSGISHCYMFQLEQSISALSDVWWYVTLLFKFQYNILKANSGYPDQTPRSAASGLGLHCLPMFHKKDARLLWDKVGWIGIPHSYQWDQSIFI